MISILHHPIEAVVPVHALRACVAFFSLNVLLTLSTTHARAHIDGTGFRNDGLS